MGSAEKSKEKWIWGGSGKEEEQTFPLSLTDGSWKGRGVEAESLQPLSGDMSVTTGGLGPA